MTGVSTDMVSAVQGHLSADASDVFLIVTVQSTGDFLQFTAVPGTVQLDFPQVTSRQRELGPKFAEVCERLGLEQTVNSGTDGAEFLDYNISGSAEAIASVIRQVLLGVFGVSSDTDLVFEANGFELNGA